MTRQKAYQAMREANIKWWDELRENFGEGAAAARFDQRGCGEPGTKLRALYEAWINAFNVWNKTK